MKVVLIRHFKVDFPWKKFYTSTDFTKACNMYDTSQITDERKINNCCGNIYISKLIRTELTSKNLNLKSNVLKTSLLDEIRMEPLFYSPVPLPTLLWMILGRLGWILNFKNINEGIIKSKARVKDFVELIVKNGEDVTVVGHGLYFTLLMSELKTYNFSGQFKPKYFKNGEMRIFNN